MEAGLRPTKKYASPTSASARLFARAVDCLLGGNTRTTVFLPPYPPYAAEGRGCWVIDVDGDERLDFLNNYTALIHGHAHPAVLEAVRRQLARGVSFSLPTEAEVALASLLVERLPAVERVRFTNSGTEAVMMAVKAARAYTGRTKIAKFEGAYHGAYDYVEVSLDPDPEAWGSPAQPASLAYSRGVVPSVLGDVVVLPFNRPQLAVQRIEREGRDLAAVILDPLPNRAGLIPATKEFLLAVREATAARGILLIFDEIIAFRVGYPGAQGYFGVAPDLTTLGKIIGGGFPVGAVGGRAEVMAVFDPRRGKPAVPHGGTFNANPVTMAAGLAALQALDADTFRRLEALGNWLRDGIAACFRDAGVPGSVTGLGSLFRIHPHARALVDYRSAWLEPTERERLARIVRYLLDHGVLLGLSGLGCLSTPMGEAEVATFLEVFRHALAASGSTAAAPA